MALSDLHVSVAGKEYGQQHGARIPTGLSELDTSIRGGVPEGGGAIVAVGPPGSGKTTWAAWQVYMWWFLYGAHVLYLARDQAPRWVLDRWGQLAGLARDSAPRAIADALAASRLYLTDKYSDDVLREFLALNGIRVIVVDALQSFVDPSDPRVGVDRLLEQLQALVGQGVIVIALSHAQKGDRRPTLASAKESSRIEHFADLMLGFHREKIHVLKAGRLGEETNAIIPVSYAGARVTPVTTILSAEDKTSSLRRRIIDVVCRIKPTNQEAVLAEVKGSTGKFHAEWTAMRQEGILEKVDGVWVVVTNEVSP